MASLEGSLLSHDNGHDHCVIVFSSFALRDYGPMAFSFRKHFEPFLHTADIVFIKDKNNQWYNRKLEALGSSRVENFNLLSKRLSHYSTIATFGSSMGGYAALMFGEALKARRIVAVSPQTFLQSPFPRFNKKLHNGVYCDLRSSCLSGVERVDIYVGENCLFDIYQVIPLQCLPNVYIRVVPQAGHKPIEKWAADGTLRTIASSLCNLDADHKGTAESDFCKLSNLSDILGVPSIAAHLSEGIELFYHGNYEDALKPLKTLVDNRPEWWGARAYLARAYAGAGKSAQALSEFSLVFDSPSDMDDYYRDYALLLAKSGHAEKALAVAERALKIDKSNYAVFKDLADIFLNCKHKGAIDICERQLERYLSPADFAKWIQQCDARI